MGCRKPELPTRLYIVVAAAAAAAAAIQIQLCPKEGFFWNHTSPPLCIAESSLILNLTPGLWLQRWCVSVLTAVLFLHENADHVTGINKTNQLWEKKKGEEISCNVW